MNDRSQADEPGRPLIAIVDADPSLRGATEQLCQASGYGTMAFESAEQFLQACEEISIDCLVMDVQLPGITGLELLAELIRRELDIAVVVATDVNDSTARDRALAQGAVAFLRKPTEGARLLDRIQFALSFRS